MILNTEIRNSQAEQRIQRRCNAATLTNVIAEGTNCSHFEAEIITRKAQEVFRLGEYSQDAPLQPGQMIWQAIDAEEPPGKPLDKCKFTRIVLTVHRLDEDRRVHSEYNMSAKRGQQILRLTAEAHDQGTLLTIEDLATILDCNEKTIRSDIKKLSKKHEISIPTRGNKCDIGSGTTHRDLVIEQFIRGKDAVSIARDLKHSLKAVERYIQTFCRIVFCQTQVRDSLKAALIAGVSSHLVSRSLALRDRLMKTKDYQDRLDEIQKMGTKYWEVQDAKKKAGPSSGRKK